MPRDVACRQTTLDPLETTTALGCARSTDALRQPGADSVSILGAHSSFVQPFDGDIESGAVAV